MALGFPLSRTAFFDQLPIKDCVLDLPETVTASRTRGGEVLRAEIGARLWTAEVRLGMMTRAEAVEVLPLINLLRGAGGSFMMADPLRLFPRFDPTGAALGAATPLLGSIASNRRDITLTGLPVGYVLARRDLLAFAYAASPTRWALHEVVNSRVVAGSSGVTTPFEVMPPIREGAAIGAAVTLVRPTCKAIIDPGSFEAGTVRAGGIHEGVSFRVRQTLR